MMNKALWVVQGLLALAFVGAGSMKMTTPIDELLANGMAFVEHMPATLVRFIGVSEVAGGLGLILPAALRIRPRLTPVAAAALVVVMVLAVITHVLLGDVGGAAPSLVLGALSAFVAWGRFVKHPIAPKLA